MFKFFKMVNLIFTKGTIRIKLETISCVLCYGVQSLLMTNTVVTRKGITKNTIVCEILVVL